jgi:uncharacterized membrane protein
VNVADALLSWMVAIPLLGAMTGLRAMTPMAVLCWFCYLHHLPIRHSWAFWAANLVTAIVFTVLAFGELIGDKLPQTPSRLDWGPLGARVVFGGLVGAIAATGLHGAAPEGILLGVTGALAGAFAGYHLRVAIKAKFGIPDLTVALAEDIFAVGLSIVAMGIITN